MGRDLIWPSLWSQKQRIIKNGGLELDFRMSEWKYSTWGLLPHIHHRIKFYLSVMDGSDILDARAIMNHIRFCCICLKKWLWKQDFFLSCSTTCGLHWQVRGMVPGTKWWLECWNSGYWSQCCTTRNYFSVHSVLLFAQGILSLVPYCMWLFLYAWFFYLLGNISCPHLFAWAHCFLFFQNVASQWYWTLMVVT